MSWWPLFGFLAFVLIFAFLFDIVYFVFGTMLHNGSYFLALIVFAFFLLVIEALWNALRRYILPARFVLLMLAIPGPAPLLTPQGRDLGTSLIDAPGWQLPLFGLALFYWAFASWHTAYLAFDRDTRNPSAWPELRPKLTFVVEVQQLDQELLEAYPRAGELAALLGRVRAALRRAVAVQAPTVEALRAQAANERRTLWWVEWQPRFLGMTAYFLGALTIALGGLSTTGGLCAFVPVIAIGVLTLLFAVVDRWHFQSEAPDGETKRGAGKIVAFVTMLITTIAVPVVIIILFAGFIQSRLLTRLLWGRQFFSFISTVWLVAVSRRSAGNTLFGWRQAFTYQFIDTESCKSACLNCRGSDTVCLGLPSRNRTVDWSS